MKAFLFLLLATVSTLAQFGGESIRPWEPRDIRTKAGLFAQYDVGQASTVTLNGSGISKVADKSWVPGRLENLLVQSEAFSTTWVRTAINAFGAVDTGAAGVGSFANTARTTDPLGGNTADFLQEDGTTSGHYILQSVASSYIAGVTYIYTVSLKQDARTGAVVRLPAAAFGSAQDGKFNLAAGTCAVGGGTPTVSIIESPAASGWYKCSVTAVATTSASSTVQIFISSDDGSTISYAGDNTKGIFAWGAQLRKSTSSSVYFPTTTVIEDASRDLLQSTASNQPIISRSDNKGNLLLQSETFNTTWSRARVNAFGAVDTGAVGAGSFANTSRTLDPLGGNTADFIQEDGTSGNSHVILQSGVQVIAGTHTFSCHVKPAGRTWVYMQVYGSYSGDNYVYGSFDCQNGIVGVVASSGTLFSSASGTIQAIANGFYKCNLTFSNLAVVSESFWIKLASANNVDSYDGDNTSGLFLWGASLRQSTWDSDYIQTTSTIALPGLNGKTTAYFDGSAHYLKSAGMASLVQPETVVFVGKQVTWTANDYLTDGNASTTTILLQQAVSPNLRLYAGSGVAENANLALGQYGLIYGLFNGPNSSLQINNTLATTGNPGSSNMQGFTLAGAATGGNYANIQVQHVLLFNQVLATPELNYVKYGGLRDVGALP